jgi:16S rRNA (guanine527-N7)-methyltransferase
VNQHQLLDIRDAAGFASAFNVSRETLGRLNLYESALRLWQKRINLVANATLDHVWQRHIADSAQVLAHIPDGAERLADFGSGAGFPGLVLAIMLAERGGPRVTLIESDQRKGAFMREVARQTGTAVDILSIRIENHETRARLGRIDVLTARALAPLDKLLGLAEPFFGEGTVGLFLKGQGAQAEVENACKQWSFDVSLVPSVTAADASLVVVRRLAPLAAASQKGSRG